MTGARHLITVLAAARRAVRLYPPAHPEHERALAELVEAVSLATATSVFTINVHQGQLYEASVPVPADSNGARAVTEALESRSIESLTLHPGFSATDALGLVEVLTLRPGPNLDVAAALAERDVRAVSVALLEQAEDPEADERRKARERDRALYFRAIAALRELQARVASAADSAGLGQTPELVSGILGRLAEEPGAVLALATLRSSSEAELHHSLNVMIYALVLGRQLQIPDEGLQSLGLAALLHDVGKTAFDSAAEGQREACRLMHPTVGAEILQRVAVEDPAPLLVAYEHHLTVDGGGWPEHTADYVAHPFSRIVAIANRYDHLVSEPGEVGGVTPDRAIAQVVSEGGTLLDPTFVRIFASAMGAFPVGCLVRLSDHSVGVVARAQCDPLSPAVRLAFDPDGNELDGLGEIELAAEERCIVEVIAPESLAVEVSEKL